MSSPTVAVAIPGFLGPGRQALLNFVHTQEHNFDAATVAVGASGTRAVVEGVRRAKILRDLGGFEDFFIGLLKEQLQPALDQLGQAPFPLGRIEAQITASNDGDYFRLHQDGGAGDTREISFVYFLHGEPRPFSGGELRIYRPPRRMDGLLTPVEPVDITPRGDTLVLFASRTQHEVLPVSVPSLAFADSRFTVNGWIHREPALVS